MQVDHCLREGKASYQLGLLPAEIPVDRLVPKLVAPSDLVKKIGLLLMYLLSLYNRKDQVQETKLVFFLVPVGAFQLLAKS